VGIVVERVALGQVSLGMLQFSLSVVIPSMSRSLVYLSEMAQRDGFRPISRAGIESEEQYKAGKNTITRCMVMQPKLHYGLYF
jgi:hypothetical protein